MSSLAIGQMVILFLAGAAFSAVCIRPASSQPCVAVRTAVGGPIAFYLTPFTLRLQRHFV